MSALTFLFKDIITYYFPEPLTPGSDAHIFRELLVTVWNQILLRLQDLKITEKEAEEIGFMLRRVWLVAKAYSEEQKTYTMKEWLAKLESLAKGLGVSIVLPP